MNKFSEKNLLNTSLERDRGRQIFLDSYNFIQHEMSNEEVCFYIFYAKIHIDL